MALTSVMPRNVQAGQDLAIRGVAFSEMPAPHMRASLVMLEALGFTLFRRHRSKNITLYKAQYADVKSGNSYMLVHDINHGMPPSLGVLVDNVDAALRAAEALADKHPIEVHASGPVGPLGLHIPAIRIADGGYLYLIGTGEADTFFAFDFATAAQE